MNFEEFKALNEQIEGLLEPEEKKIELELEIKDGNVEVEAKIDDVEFEGELKPEATEEETEEDEAPAENEEIPAEEVNETVEEENEKAENKRVHRIYVAAYEALEELMDELGNGVDPHTGKLDPETDAFYDQLVEINNEIYSRSLAFEG